MAGPDSGGDPDPYLAHHDLIEQAIRTFCRRQRLSATEAEDFASEVRLHLLDRERAVLRAFEGRSSFRTYLLTVIRHQFRDWRNALWGKWRPSAEARRLGPLAVRLEMLLVRDRLPLDRRWTFQLNKQRPPRRLGPRALADQVSFEMPLDAAFDYALALTAGGTRLTPEIELPRDASTTVTIVNRDVHDPEGDPTLASGFYCLVKYDDLHDLLDLDHAEQTHPVGDYTGGTGAAGAGDVFALSKVDPVCGGEQGDCPDPQDPECEPPGSGGP